MPRMCRRAAKWGRARRPGASLQWQRAPCASWRRRPVSRRAPTSEKKVSTLVCLEAEALTNAAQSSSRRAPRDDLDICVGGAPYDVSEGQGSRCGSARGRRESYRAAAARRACVSTSTHFFRDRGKCRHAQTGVNTPGVDTPKQVLTQVSTHQHGC